MKNLFGLKCVVKPRLFGNTSILAIESKIDELLQSDVFVICVFDMDVYVRDKASQKSLERFQNKYKDNPNLLLCRSLPSIEYWFLLHFEKTNRSFRDAKETESVLKRHIVDYEKSKKFLEKEKWVKDLCSDNRLELATARANDSQHTAGGSYTNIPDGLVVLFKTDDVG